MSKSRIYILPKSVLIIMFLYFGLNGFSQKSYYLESKSHIGLVVPHRAGMESLAQQPSMGTEINFYKKRDKDNFYDAKYNSPYSGFGVSYQYLGNPNVLGNSYAIYSFMEFDFLKIKSINFNTRINAGLNYVTEKYDFDTNTENIAIGSNINFYFNMSFGLHYQFRNLPLSMRVNAGIIHYSNGSVMKPNRGLNQLYASIGVSYLLNNSQTYQSDYVLDKTVLKPHEFNAMATLTSSDEYMIGDQGRGGGYLCSTVALGYSYMYSPSGKVGVSADVFYNENLYWYYDTNWDNLVKIYEKPSDIIRAGVSFGHELVYKKLSFVSYVGLYYHKKVKPHDYFYSRFGLRYFVLKNVYVNATLKAYGFKAHYIESGIGFYLRR